MNEKIKASLEEVVLRAYHQAGHAVACRVLDKQFEKLSIGKHGTFVSEETEGDNNEIIISMAGIFAELIYDSNSKNPSILSDEIDFSEPVFLEDMHAIISSFNNYNMQNFHQNYNYLPIILGNIDFLKSIENRTIEILRSNWPAIKDLVAELIFWGEIDYLYACQIIDNAVKME